jgi:hypothetical protein
MTTITVEIASKRQAAQFAALAKNLKYVKSVRFGNGDELTPLTDDDWVRPGRPATEKEIESRISECEYEYSSGNCIPIEKLDEKISGHLKLKGYDV